MRDAGEVLYQEMTVLYIYLQILFTLGLSRIFPNASLNTWPLGDLENIIGQRWGYGSVLISILSSEREALEKQGTS